jgi:hypothetical protein
MGSRIRITGKARGVGETGVDGILFWMDQPSDKGAFHINETKALVLASPAELSPQQARRVALWRKLATQIGHSRISRTTRLERNTQATARLDGSKEFLAGYF